MAVSSKIVQVDVDALSGAVSAAIVQAIAKAAASSATNDVEESTTGRKRRYSYTVEACVS